MKTSVQLIHPIEYDPSGQNKSMHDEESRKVEHLSTTNDQLRSEYCITKRVLANSIRICWEHTLRDRFFKQRSEKRKSFNRATQLFQARAIFACLLDRAGCRQSDHFPNSARDRPRRQQGAQVLQRIFFSVQNELLYFRALLPYSTLRMSVFRHLVLRSSIQSDIDPNSDTFFFLFSLISLIADGPHHYHPAYGHKGSSHLSPVHALPFFIAMQVQHSYNSSTNG